jgi:hypothetical protein
MVAKAKKAVAPKPKAPKQMTLFDQVAMAITEKDLGGKAKRQLDITEARQALKNALLVLKKMPFGDVAAMVQKYRAK